MHTKHNHYFNPKQVHQIPPKLQILFYIVKSNASAYHKSANYLIIYLN